ncbi:M15 family metallopeptidase [Flavobacterium sp. RHBU_3]|uniref:M15 family metallopeptidase n=1 Tax=Flavobacterium sp. RHBU_3 TaxID=3391184 RepID=UPI003985206C
MSYQLLKEDVLFYQRLLKSAGLYKYGLDGDWGPKTSNADADFIAKYESLKAQYGGFDPRSEQNIITLHPKAQEEARKFLKLAQGGAFQVRIISGTRTYAEQNALYRQGRYGNSGPVVTNAKGGQSNHNFGIAWDIGLFDSHGYNTVNANYIAIANKVMPQLSTLEWGGDWKSIKDNPHYQLKAVSNSVAIIRQKFENGQAYV